MRDAIVANFCSIIFLLKMRGLNPEWEKFLEKITVNRLKNVKYEDGTIIIPAFY